MLKYSQQASVILENMKDFDKEHFEKWFMTNLSVGSNNILEYMMFKKQLEQEKKRLEELENGHPEL